MDIKGFALTLGVGVAAGAVTVLMLPKRNPARRLADQAATGMEHAMWQMTDRIGDMMD